jgi:hypothetical protein
MADMAKTARMTQRRLVAQINECPPLKMADAAEPKGRQVIGNCEEPRASNGAVMVQSFT